MQREGVRRAAHRAIDIPCVLDATRAWKRIAPEPNERIDDANRIARFGRMWPLSAAAQAAAQMLAQMCEHLRGRACSASEVLRPPPSLELILLDQTGAIVSAGLHDADACPRAHFIPLEHPFDNLLHRRPSAERKPGEDGSTSWPGLLNRHRFAHPPVDLRDVLLPSVRRAERVARAFRELPHARRIAPRAALWLTRSAPSAAPSRDIGS